MSDFTQWSRWFECGLEIKRHRAHALAVMAWIAAHTSSDGSGIEFNPETWTSLADETGLTREEGKAAVDALIAEGLMTAVGQEMPDLIVVRAVV
jgi:hypothetical protein